ncbi:hypothetical protein [Neisseria meningitidis]|uniref:hypothetical protein n=1 Tax=Neisseria meningitidis TaxID=487 RepID=UPI003CC6188B
MGLKKACLTVLCLIVFCFGIFYTFDRVNQGERNAVSLLKDKLFNEEGEPVNLIFCYTIADEGGGKDYGAASGGAVLCGADV